MPIDEPKIRSCLVYDSLINFIFLNNILSIEQFPMK